MKPTAKQWALITVVAALAFFAGMHTWRLDPNFGTARIWRSRHIWITQNREPVLVVAPAISGKGAGPIELSYVIDEPGKQIIFSAGHGYGRRRGITGSTYVIPARQLASDQVADPRKLQIRFRTGDGSLKASEEVTSLELLFAN